MRTLKKLYRSLPARIAAAMVLASAGVILSDLYVQVVEFGSAKFPGSSQSELHSIPLAVLGFVLIGLGLLLIPGFGAGGESPQEG